MQGTGSTMATSACLRRVVAPPGRLAITLRDGKAPWKGPYVFGLEADSPLISAVALGWRLIAVNDTSVHDFSCHAAARLLKFVDNSKDDRVLLFAAPPTNGPTISWYGSCGIALAMTALSIVVALAGGPDPPSGVGQVSSRRAWPRWTRRWQRWRWELSTWLCRRQQLT